MNEEELKAQLAEMQAAVERAEREMAPIKGTIGEANAKKHAAQQAFDNMIAQLRAEHQARLQRINEEINPLVERMETYQYDANQLIDAINKKRDELAALQNEQRQREMQEKIEADARTAELKALADKAALSKNWDYLTAGAPWREMAADHQIKGAHKIVADRYVILADPMGLGKTLTAIATTDMAQAATVDASPEHPWLGIEKEVYVHAKWVNGETGEERKGYIGYDERKRMEADYNWQQIPAHYEVKIVDAVERPVGRRILYICPAPLLRNVMAEFHQWNPKRNVTFIGAMSKAERNFFLDNIMPQVPDCVVIVNYEAWRRDLQLLAKLASYKFDTVIIDEAHMTKNQKTSAWKGVNYMVQGANRPEYVIPMTGTPILNRPQELFTLLNMVNPDEFRVENDFLYSYCEQYEDSTGMMRWKFRAGGLDSLQHKISKNFLRRTKDQAGIKLPPKTIIYHDLDVDEELYSLQAKARKQMRDYATLVINESKGQTLIATVKIALITRLRQIETWPAGIIQRDKHTKEIILQLEVHESQKIDYCIRWDEESNEWEGLIPEAIEDERMVVFSQFNAPLHEIARRVNASGKRAVVMDSAASTKLKEEIRVDFDARFTPLGADYKWDIVLCGYKAGGVGLNFTAASQLISLDDEWNPGKRDQAWDRIHRMGQIRPATIHVVRDKKTIDDWMASIMADKEAVVDGFTRKMEDAISADDLLRAIQNGEV